MATTLSFKKQTPAAPATEAAALDKTLAKAKVAHGPGTVTVQEAHPDTAPAQDNPCKSAMFNDDDPVTGEPIHRHWTATPAPLAVVHAPAAPAPVAQKRSMLASDDAIRMEDINLPTLNIVQGVGELSSIFDPGSIVFNKAIILAYAPAKGIGPESDPVRIVVLGFRPTRYSEQIKGGERGRIVDSEAAVHAIGGTTVWKEAFVDGEQVKDYFQALATAIVLVEAPGENPNEDDFPLDATDNSGKVRRYALGLWHLRGTAHTNAARPLKTARALTWLRKGYSSRVVTIRTTMKVYGSNRAFIPIVRPPAAGDTEGTPSAALQALSASVLSALTGEASSDPQGGE